MIATIPIFLYLCKTDDATLTFGQPFIEHSIMSRKAFFTKEDFIEAGVSLVRDLGIDALTARTLSKRMGCSTSPIFSVYENLSQLKDDVVKRVCEMYEDYVADSINYNPAFKEFGRRVVQFGINEPRLFNLVMQPIGQEHHHFRTPVEVKLEEELCHLYHITQRQARVLVEQMQIFTTGMATRYSSGWDAYSDDTINFNLGAAFLGMLMYVKEMDRLPIVSPLPRDNDNQPLIPN